MSLVAFAQSIQPLGHPRVALHVNGHALEFNRPEPTDMIEAFSPKAEESLMGAAELLQGKDPGFVVPSHLLTTDKGYSVYLLAKCYCPTAEDTEAAGGQFAPLEYFLSIAARNPYAFDLLENEFAKAFPAFMDWLMQRIGGALPGNSLGGGKPGEAAPNSTPGEVPAPPSEPSAESPSTEGKSSKKSESSAGEN